MTTDRELALRISVDDAGAAAKLDALKDKEAQLVESTTAVGAAGETAAGGLAAQGEAAQATAAGLDTATTSNIQLTTAVTALEGQVAVAAITAKELGPDIATSFELGTQHITGADKSLKALVTSLAVAESQVASFKAKGVFIPPILEENVTKLRTALMSIPAAAEMLTGGVEKAAAGTEKASLATKIFTDLTRLGGMEAGRFGSLLKDVGKEADGAAGMMAGLALPVTAAIAIFFALSKALEGFRDRGIDVVTLGDLMGKAMDSLAVGLGGTTKAVGEMEASVEKAQKTLADLDVTARSYKDSSDLLTAAGIDASKVFEQLGNAGSFAGSALAHIQGGMEGTEGSVRSAKNSLDDFNKSLLAVRTVDPEEARRLQDSFLNLAKSLREGAISEEVFAKGLQDLREKMTPLTATATEVGAALKEKFGKGAQGAGDELAHLLQTALLTPEKLQVMAAQGISTGAAFDVVKSDVLKANGELERLIGIVTKFNLLTPEQIEKLRQMAAGHDAVAEATRKHEAAMHGFENVNADFNEAIAYGVKVLGSQGAAIDALAPKIEKQVVSIEKQRDALTGKLDPALQRILDQNLHWLESIGVLDPRLRGMTDDIDKQAEKLGKLVEAQKKSEKAWSDASAEIEKHRATTLRALDEQTDKMRQSFAQQYAALSSRNASFATSQQEYVDQFNKIQAEEVDARRRADEARYQANKKADEDQAALDKKEQDRFKDFEEKLGEQASSLTVAQTRHAEYDLSVRTHLVGPMADAATAVGNVNKVLLTLGADGIPKIQTALDGLVTHATDVARALRDVRTAAEEAFPVPQGSVTTEFAASEGVPAGSVTTTPSF